MSKIFTPVNQVKLTNVTVVRLKKGGKRFEIACYNNKVLEYRNKVTKDLSEVLQSSSVFTNVSKGELAPKDEVAKVFGNMDTNAIIKEILDKGELQVTGKERTANLESLFKEVANTISHMCVNPQNQQPYPASIIERAMHDAHVNLAASGRENRGAKQIALEVIKTLKQGVNGKPILLLERAQMRVIIDAPIEAAGRIRLAVSPLLAVIEGDFVEESSINITGLVDPGNFHALKAAVSKANSNGSVHVLNLKALRDN